MHLLTPIVVLALWPAMHQAATQPVAPTDQEIRQKLSELKPTNSDGQRLEVFRWLNRHADAKNMVMALPVLELAAREDPVTKIRGEALLSLGIVAGKSGRPCPLIVFEAFLDKEEEIRMMAAGGANYCTHFTPGVVPILLRSMQSDDANARFTALSFLGRVDKTDPKALEAIEKAKGDKSSAVRNMAHGAHFQATDRLEGFLRYLILLREDPAAVLPPLPEGKEEQAKDKVQRNLFVLGAAAYVDEWSDKRPDDLVAALLRLLDDASPSMRRGAIVLIGACARKYGPYEDFAGGKLKTLAEGHRLVPEKTAAGFRLDKLQVENRLRQIRDEDPNASIREAASTTLERLQKVAKQN